MSVNAVLRGFRDYLLDDWQNNPECVEMSRYTVIQRMDVMALISTFLNDEALRDRHPELQEIKDEAALIQWMEMKLVTQRLTQS